MSAIGCALALGACASVLGIEDVYEGPASNAGAPNATSGAAGTDDGGSGASLGGDGGRGAGAGSGGSGGRGGGSAGRGESGAGGAPLGGKAGGTGSGGAPTAGAPNAGGPNGGAPAAGTGGTPGACRPDEARCAESGRETCSADAEWVAMPCPVNTPTCEDGACVVRGPTMVKVADFYIDSTEVTVAQYAEFLEAKGTDTSGQPSVCSWNTAYDDISIMKYPDDNPRTYVDWCDAVAFCTWAGKRLCGRIGGGPATRTELYQTANSQWFLACGGPNSASHPRVNAVCNYSGVLADVASYDGCEGFYPGLFDMEGNAREWVDSCEGTTGASDTCRLIGSGTVDDSGFCDTVPAEYARNYKAMPFGFRCCSE